MTDFDADALARKLLATWLDRARVVGILDAWAERGVSRHWRSGPSVSKEASYCQLVDASAKIHHIEHGDTIDAARAVAAKWIEAGEFP